MDLYSVSDHLTICYCNEQSCAYVMCCLVSTSSLQHATGLGSWDRECMTLQSRIYMWFYFFKHIETCIYCIETGFYYLDLAITGTPSNSTEICLPLPPRC